MRVVTTNGSSDVVSFTALPFEMIARISGGGGYISPPSQEVPYGGTAVLSIAPYAGYCILSIIDNGSVATITNPAGMKYASRISERIIKWWWSSALSCTPFPVP